MAMHNPTGDYIQMIQRDPRCPQCGNAVIGPSIQGVEGQYHPECTKPPFPTIYPYPSPIRPQPWEPIGIGGPFDWPPVMNTPPSPNLYEIWNTGCAPSLSPCR